MNYRIAMLFFMCLLFGCVTPKGSDSGGGGAPESGADSRGGDTGDLTSTGGDTNDTGRDSTTDSSDSSASWEDSSQPEDTGPCNDAFVSGASWSTNFECSDRVLEWFNISGEVDLGDATIRWNCDDAANGGCSMRVTLDGGLITSPFDDGICVLITEELEIREDYQVKFHLKDYSGTSLPVGFSVVTEGEALSGEVDLEPSDVLFGASTTFIPTSAWVQQVWSFNAPDNYPALCLALGQAADVGVDLLFVKEPSDD